MRRISTVLALFVASSCGFDGLFVTPRSFDPTPPPTVTLVGVTEGGAAITVHDQGGNLVATSNADAAGNFGVQLPAEVVATNLRVTATRDGTRFKTIVPFATTDEQTPVGRLDALSTALAQLATYEIVEEAGSSFSATPATALAALLTSMEDRSPALVALVDVVQSFTNAPVPMFDPLTHTLDASASPQDAERYGAALSAAAADYGLVVRCDPSRLNVMFTVDGSGRGRDGNGLPQLIRQPTAEGRIFLGFTGDESSQVTSDDIPRRLTPNDVRYAMTDDGENGDEVANDGIFTVVVPLPRGARLLYKYTNGAAGQGFTGAEEWPGNARIIEVEDVLTGRPDGEPDCLVIRRDSFGDEATNKNFVNLHPRAKARGGSVAFETDLGGAEIPVGPSGAYVGGLFAEDLRGAAPLTPAGVPEARENGVCTKCPAPLVLDPDDVTPPQLVAAERLATNRVRVRFSEPILREDAERVASFLYLDDAGRAVPVLAASPSGADVLLTLEPTHPRAPASIAVRSMRDASVRGNLLETAQTEVTPDRTPPRVQSVTPMSILDVDPEATVEDPTVGDLIELVLDEVPESSAASDPARFLIDGLEVLAATPLDTNPPRIRLATATQVKGAPYTLTVRGLRDPAGNAIEQELPFEGFALYEVTFGVVPGFAFSSSDGTERGLPRGEALYLTGTPLASARDLMGRDISVVAEGFTRTDVTGWPQFEMTPGARAHAGAPVFEKTVLLPQGSWAYKAAHGVEGEYVRPPTTLEKVYKTLTTANDATGVRVDPVTMIAANGRDYTGASLSESGDEPPRSDVVFKREAPDEVCEVHRDTVCPYIVLGGWRDLVLDPGGRTRDYDDGIIALAPHRPELPDLDAPRLLDARARDSFSILLSFDETIVAPETTLAVSVTRARDGVGVRTEVLASSEVEPHQAVVRLVGDMCEAGLSPGAAYSVSYRGARNEAGLVQRESRTQTILAPDRCRPFSPLTDVTPPGVVRVDAVDLTELHVYFDERIDPASIDATAFEIPGLTVESAAQRPDRTSVRLITSTQSIRAPYRLTATGLADYADPPNVVTSTSVDFLGFGELDPPRVVRARAIDASEILLRFDEPLDVASAMNAASYGLDGGQVRAVRFSGDPGRRNLAFNPELAPRVMNVVILETSPLTEGANHRVTIDGVKDRSGNAVTTSVEVVGVATPPTVTVALEVVISDQVAVAGSIPSRSISPAVLMNAREGVFVLGARATPDHTPVAGAMGPVNASLGGFGVEGQPLDGIEPRLLDNGAAPDRKQADNVYTIAIPNVPLKTTIIWKAFAPFTVTYKDTNPNDSLAAFADALPGPSVFADGQEYPGNENGIIVLDDGDGDGILYVRALFGDEISYKKNTGAAAYIWAAEDADAE